MRQTRCAQTEARWVFASGGRAAAGGDVPKTRRRKEREREKTRQNFRHWPLEGTEAWCALVGRTPHSKNNEMRGWMVWRRRGHSTYSRQDGSALVPHDSRSSGSSRPEVVRMRSRKRRRYSCAGAGGAAGVGRRGGRQRRRLGGGGSRRGSPPGTVGAAGLCRILPCFPSPLELPRRAGPLGSAARPAGRLGAGRGGWTAPAAARRA